MLSDASGWPFSVMVGTLGMDGIRLVALVARATTSPLRSTESMGLSDAAPTWTWPPSTAFFTGPDPPKGTWVMSSP